MTDRIIEIADTAAHLSYENNLLKMQFSKDRIITVPVSEIQCLIIANPAITVTGALLSQLSEAGAIVVISGADRLPTAMQLPLNGNYIQNERFSTILKLYKPQHEGNRRGHSGEYSTILKLYKPQQTKFGGLSMSEYSTILKLYKPQRTR